MGMFDYIVCEMPLPGTVPAFIEPGHEFQTKDTPEQLLRTYRFGADKELYGPDGQKLNFTGDIDFYTSNICGCGPGVYTTDGADAESVAFNAHVVGGRVQSLEQTEYEIKPALPSVRQFGGALASPPLSLPRFDPYTGQILYVWWGGEKSGYTVQVVAFNSQQTVVASLEDHTWAKAGCFEILQGGWGATVFPDKETAVAVNTSRKDDWNARKKEYEDYSAKWREERNRR